MHRAIGVSWQASPLIETTATRRTTDSAPARASSPFHSGTLRILEQRCPDQKRPTNPTFRPTRTGGELVSCLISLHNSSVMRSALQGDSNLVSHSTSNRVKNPAAGSPFVGQLELHALPFSEMRRQPLDRRVPSTPDRMS